MCLPSPYFDNVIIVKKSYAMQTVSSTSNLQWKHCWSWRNWQGLVTKRASNYRKSTSINSVTHGKVDIDIEILMNGDSLQWKYSFLCHAVQFLSQLFLFTAQFSNYYLTDLFHHKLLPYFAIFRIFNQKNPWHTTQQQQQPKKALVVNCPHTR